MAPVLPPVEVDWSDDTGQAAWIAARLRPLGAGVGSVVPSGYGAYARIDHAGGAVGSLSAPELATLAAVLGPATTTPGRCWFCLWTGYGWVTGGAAVAGLSSGPGRRRGRRRDAVPGAVPPAVLRGPLVRLPGREYALSSGEARHAAAWIAHPYRQSPNLWWPHDRAWVVGTEIDLACTYVGAAPAVVEQLAGTGGLRVSPTSPDDPLPAT